MGSFRNDPHSGLRSLPEALTSFPGVGVGCDHGPRSPYSGALPTAAIRDPERGTTTHRRQRAPTFLPKRPTRPGAPASATSVSRKPGGRSPKRDAPGKGGKAPEWLRACEPPALPVCLLPPRTAPRPPASRQAPFAKRDDGPAAVLDVVLIHRHLAPGPLLPPLGWEGRGLRQAVGRGFEGEGGDYGARTRSRRGASHVGAGG